MSSLQQMEQWSGARAGTPARAVVCAGGVDIPYIRAGRGKAVVFLAADIDSIDAQREIDVLAQSFLIIAASPPPELDFSVWLNGLLDGLGITRAGILLDESLAPFLSIGDRNDV